MGEKRKARPTNNERIAKKEKKSVDSITVISDSDEIEESSSVQSNGSTTDSNTQLPSTTKENTNPDDIEESEPIPSIDGVDVTTTEENGEAKLFVNGDHVNNNNDDDYDNNDDDNNNKVANEYIQPTKSWWSSIIRLFHFRNNSNENKSEINETNDNESTPYMNGSYLSNIKCRRSLHDESLVN